MFGKRRIALIVLIVFGAAGALAGARWKNLSARYAAFRFERAPSEEAKQAAASELVRLGEPGLPHLQTVLRSDDAQRCAAVAAAIVDIIRDLPANDPQFSSMTKPHLVGFPEYSPAGQEAILPLVAEFTRAGDPESLQQCRELVRIGLKHPSAESRVRAISLAMRPELDQKADVVGCLSAKEAEVRRAAMLAVGPMGAGSAAIGDEDLFPWLHDGDAQVQMLCEAALTTRGLEPEQIAAARKLSSADLAERLNLLIDLRWNREAIRDPGPWLERLSRDADPAVRAGAARVACECQLAFAGWLDRLAKDDPDGTVRQIVRFHRNRAAQIKQAGFGGE